MIIKKRSKFQDPQKDITYFNNWVRQLQKLNNRIYEKIELNTSLGKTQVWGLNIQRSDAEVLLIFPGARTSALFWDFDRGLDSLGKDLNIFLVETNGLPNSSDGNTPDIKSLDYGYWAVEILDKLGIQKAFIAGASFGGLICMKLGIVAPERVKAAFLLNPGCLQQFSLKLKNLYYNLLPIISPSEKTVSKFLDKAVFSKPNHQLSQSAEQLLIDYEIFAIKRYKDQTQKPYYMETELAEVKVDTYLLEGDKDLLFPFDKSIANARKHLKTLKEVKVFQNVGHGIETYSEAIKYVGEKLSIIKKTRS